MRSLRLKFDRRPSAIAFMLRALCPSRGLGAGKQIAPVSASWSRKGIDPAEFEEFLRLTGLSADGGVPILYPHVFGFRLIMAVLTHPAFPLPIWRALQIRNRLRQHAPIDADAMLDLTTAVGACRVLGKGVEIDLNTAVQQRGRLVWESVNTFYYRGSYGGAEAVPAAARPPEVAEEEAARWRTLSSPGWRFARLTGDYNGIHSWDWYARLFGFRKAFHHPQLILGQCMARLPRPVERPAQELDAWLKGPVAYDSDVRLCASERSAGVSFALTTVHDSRPAIIGDWRRVGL